MNTCITRSCNDVGECVRKSRKESQNIFHWLRQIVLVQAGILGGLCDRKKGSVQIDFYNYYTIIKSQKFSCRSRMLQVLQLSFLDNYGTIKRMTRRILLRNVVSAGIIREVIKKRRQLFFILSSKGGRFQRMRTEETSTRSIITLRHVALPDCRAIQISYTFM